MAYIPLPVRGRPKKNVRGLSSGRYIGSMKRAECDDELLAGTSYARMEEERHMCVCMYIYIYIYIYILCFRISPPSLVHLGFLYRHIYIYISNIILRPSPRPTQLTGITTRPALTSPPPSATRSKRPSPSRARSASRSPTPRTSGATARGLWDWSTTSIVGRVASCSTPRRKRRRSRPRRRKK